MKRCLSVFLSLLMVMGTVSAVIGGTSLLSFADDPEVNNKCGENLTWNYSYPTNYGILEISGSGDMYDYDWLLDVPWYGYDIAVISLKGEITSIGNWAFASCNNITDVHIPDSVTRIGDNAFWGCPYLSIIYMSAGVRSIGADAFKNDEKLIQVIFHGFREQWNGIDIAEGNSFLTEAPLYAWNYDFTTQTLTLGCKGEYRNFLYLAPSPWNSYRKLIKNAVVDEEMTRIGDHLFYECDNLKDVYYPGTEEQWSKIDIGEDNEPLFKATVHFNSAGPQPGAAPAGGSCENAALEIKAPSSVNYNRSVTVTVTATGVPEGYMIAIFENNNLSVIGDNKSASCKVKKLAYDTVFSAKVIDGNGTVQKDAGGNDLAVNCEVKVKRNFFYLLMVLFSRFSESHPYMRIWM